jgi:hypothetical protein
LRLASLRLAKLRLAPFRLARNKSAPLRLASNRSALLRLAPKQVGAAQIGVAQVGALQVGVAEVGVAVGAAQVCIQQIVTGEPGHRQVRTIKLKGPAQRPEMEHQPPDKNCGAYAQQRPCSPGDPAEG